MKNIMTKKMTELSSREFATYNAIVLALVTAVIFVIHAATSVYLTHSFDLGESIAFTLVNGAFFGGLCVVGHIVGRAIRFEQMAKAAEAE